MGGVRCKLGQFPEDVGTRTGGDVHVVCEGSTVGGGTGEGILLGGLNCECE